MVIFLHAFSLFSPQVYLHGNGEVDRSNRETCDSNNSCNIVSDDAVHLGSNLWYVTEHADMKKKNPKQTFKKYAPKNKIP